MRVLILVLLLSGCGTETARFCLCGVDAGADAGRAEPESVERDRE